jgi:integrase
MARATITRTLFKDPPPLPDGVDKVRTFDDRLTGFIAERRRTGVTFYFRYADGRGRTREVKLGRLGDVTVDQARKKAEELRASVSLGGDPLAERDRRRAVPTLQAFADERYLPHAEERLRGYANVKTYLRLHILPALGRKALDEVTTADVAALRRRLIDTRLAPGTVNRYLATLRSMLNLARKWGLAEGPNPAASPGMLPERHRDRYLSAPETKALMAALDRADEPASAAAIALLVLTGARKNEVLRATWADVDLERCVLGVPAERSKNGRPRHIPLSPAALRVIARQQAARRGGCAFVFPGRKADAPLTGVKRTWATAKREAGLPADLRMHDLRHSFASALANAGTPLNEIGAILGHRQLATTTRYAHHAPQRLVETASVPARAWDLLPPAAVEEGEESEAEKPAAATS